MSPVEFTKRPCRPVDFRGQGPSGRLQIDIGGGIPSCQVMESVPDLERSRDACPSFFFNVKVKHVILKISCKHNPSFFKCVN